jgi:hypothetical protein
MKEYLKGLSQYEYKDNQLIPTLTVEIWDEETIPTITPLVDWEATYDDDADDDAEVLPFEDLD